MKSKINELLEDIRYQIYERLYLVEAIDDKDEENPEDDTDNKITNQNNNKPEPDLVDPNTQVDPTPLDPTTNQPSSIEPKPDPIPTKNQPTPPTPYVAPPPVKKTSKLKPKELQTINKQEAEAMIIATRGRFFTASFIKKDGSNRIMNARLGVRSYLKGGSLPYDPKKFNYLPVFDTRLREYRILNLNTLTSLTVGGKTYLVK